MDEIIDIDDLRKLKLPELKALCKQTGVPSSGAKDVLIKRLAISMGMDEEDEPVDEDALLEEEEEDKEEDAGVSSSDKEQSSEPAGSNEVTNDSVVVSEDEQAKPADKLEPPGEDKGKENDTRVSSPKKIKLIEAPPADPPKPVAHMSDAERLKLRAEKYGVNTAKGAISSKEARAARFGVASSKGAAASERKTPSTGKGATAAVSAPKNVSAEDLEKMKQRSLRFGATVSSTLSSVDSVDKILKRKERFGVVAKGKPNDSAKEKRAERFGTAAAAGRTATTAKTPASTPEMDELKKKRAERFKITAP